MSTLTADTLMPLFSALPEDQQHVFADQIKKFLQHKNRPVQKKKRTIDKVAEQLGEEWLPENRERMITKIMNGF